MTKVKLTIVVETELKETLEEIEGICQEYRGMSYEEVLKEDVHDEIIEPNFDLDKDRYTVEVELSE